jgi:hypothetical protein
MNEQTSEQKTTTFSKMNNGDIFMRHGINTIFVFSHRVGKRFYYGEYLDKSVMYTSTTNRQVILLENVPL